MTAHTSSLYLCTFLNCNDCSRKTQREMNDFHTAHHDCSDRCRSDMCGSEQTPSSTPRFSQFRHRQHCSKMASTSSSSPFASVVSPLAHVYDRFSQWKIALGLSNPGTVENLTKEVKCELRPALYHHHTPFCSVISARRVISHVLYTLESRVIDD